jgi:hypothetical protein
MAYHVCKGVVPAPPATSGKEKTTGAAAIVLQFSCNVCKYLSRLALPSPDLGTIQGAFWGSQSPHECAQVYAAAIERPLGGQYQLGKVVQGGWVHRDGPRHV